MQMQIGAFRFDAAPGAAEYAELAHARQRQWASRARHGRPAELEDLGRSASTLDLRGTIWVTTAADLEALETLKREAGLLPDDEGREVVARPLPVFRGGSDGDSGESLGQWVVTRLLERERDLRVDGIPTQVAFEVSLTEYVA